MIADAIAAAGAVAAAAIAGIVLLNQVRGNRRSYLRLNVSARLASDDLVIVALEVANDMTSTKWVQSGFVLIGPEWENPVQTFNVLCPASEACCAIDFERAPESAPGSIQLSRANRRLIPLSFLTEENDSIGNEVLRFEVSTRLTNADCAGTLSVRFFVFGHRERGADIHRKVQTLLLIPSTPDRVGRTAEVETIPIPTCKRLKGCNKYCIEGPRSRLQ